MNRGDVPVVFAQDDPGAYRTSVGPLGPAALTASVTLPGWWWLNGEAPNPAECREAEATDLMKLAPTVRSQIEVTFDRRT